MAGRVVSTGSGEGAVLPTPAVPPIAEIRTAPGARSAGRSSSAVSAASSAGRPVKCGTPGGSLLGSRSAEGAHLTQSDMQAQASSIHELKSSLPVVDKQPAPPLLPILRSQQQGEILALLLGNPGLELSLTEIAARVGAPHPSVYREVQRAEQTGLVTTRKVGNTRLVRANTASPYYAGLAEVLTRAFGVPAVLAESLA